MSATKLTHNPFQAFAQPQTIQEEHTTQATQAKQSKQAHTNKTSGITVVGDNPIHHQSFQPVQPVQPVQLIQPSLPTMEVNTRFSKVLFRCEDCGGFINFTMEAFVHLRNEMHQLHHIHTVGGEDGCKGRIVPVQTYANYDGKACFTVIEYYKNSGMERAIYINVPQGHPYTYFDEDKGVHKLSYKFRNEKGRYLPKPIRERRCFITERRGDVFDILYRLHRVGNIIVYNYDKGCQE